MHQGARVKHPIHERMVVTVFNGLFVFILPVHPLHLICPHQLSHGDVHQALNYATRGIRAQVMVNVDNGSAPVVLHHI
jgi:hypothetical protein